MRHPLDPDSDGGGQSDGAEIQAGQNPLNPLDDARPATDSDDDGLQDREEDHDGDGRIGPRETNPGDHDTDDDGLSDGVELALVPPTDPLDPDTDDDGLRDGLELNGENPTDPNDPDTDGDGIPDGIEDRDQDGRRDASETDPNQTDTDEEGQPDNVEDSDQDGRWDQDETDPLNPDTDSDGLYDGFEDIDRDGEVDVGETDPRHVDSDRGGEHDGDEVMEGRDPLDRLDDRIPFVDSDGDGLADWKKTKIETERSVSAKRTPKTAIPTAMAFSTAPRSRGPMRPTRSTLTQMETALPMVAKTITSMGVWTLAKIPMQQLNGDGLADGVEDVNQNGLRSPDETDPRDEDTDNDGRHDGIEITSGRPQTHWCRTPTRTAKKTETTMVGLTPMRPIRPVRIPTKAEKTMAGSVFGRDPRDPEDDDGDGDGLSVANERSTGTEPNDADTDGDGLTDGQEDLDRDGLRDPDETDPLNSDTDSDGLNDGIEDAMATAIVPMMRRILNPDTDGDGLPDGSRMQCGRDGADRRDGSRRWDSDGDGIGDGDDGAPLIFDHPTNLGGTGQADCDCAATETNYTTFGGFDGRHAASAPSSPSQSAPKTCPVLPPKLWATHGPRRRPKRGMERPAMKPNTTFNRFYVQAYSPSVHSGAVIRKAAAIRPMPEWAASGFRQFGGMAGEAGSCGDGGEAVEPQVR